MKLRTQPKLLITALFAGMIAAPVAMAETHVYGQAHLSVDSISGNGNSGMQTVSNSSRFGVKGSIELNSGLTGVYQLESGADVSGHSGNLFTGARDSFAGVSGDFGTIIGGRLGVVNQWLYDANLFGDQVGDLGNYWGVGGLPGRANGVVAYASPDLGGFDFMVAYKPDDGVKDTGATVAKVNAAMGDLKLGLGYTSLGKAIFDDTTPLPATAEDTTVMALTASYNMGAIRIVGGMQQTQNGNGTKDNNYDAITLGASIGLSDDITVKGQFSQVSSKADKAGATGFALGLDYNLGKATTAYVAYAATANEDNAAIGVAGWGHTDRVSGETAGETNSAISVGIVHKFGGKL